MGKRVKMTPRRWTISTKGTYMLHARIPRDLMDDLRSYVDTQGVTITEVVIMGLCHVVRDEDRYIPVAPAREARAPGRRTDDAQTYGGYWIL